jgi:hypothetical protein
MDALSKRVDQLLEISANTKSATEITVAAFGLAETLQPDEFASAIATLASKSTAGTMIAGYWAEVDLAAALQWLNGLPPDAKEKFAPSILDTWSASDPRGVLGWVEQLPEDARSRILRTVAQRLANYAGPLEPERVLALLAPLVTLQTVTSEGTTVETGVSPLFEALARKAPTDAAARALALPSGAMRTEAARSVAREWAKSDPQSARQWAESINDAALAAQVVPACAVGLASKDPAAAAEWVGSLPATVANLNATRQVMRAWGGSDAPAALAWIDTMPKSDAEGYAGEIIAELARRDVSTAMQLVLQRAASERPIGEPWTLGWEYARIKGASDSLQMAAQLRALNPDWNVRQICSSLVQQAAMQDRQMALKWAMEQPAGDRAFALSAVAAGFASDDPRTAARWASALPRDDVSDAARKRIAYDIRHSEPALSLQLTSQMTESEERRDLMSQTVRLWLYRRRDEATAWLESSPLFSAEEKARLLVTRGL